MRQLSGQGKCFFELKRKNNVQDYIDYALKSPFGMVIGKFLIPEICEELHFTIEHLKQLEPLINRLDDRHIYEKIIYDSYLENNAFYLTQEQRDLAYKIYKESRGN